MNALIALEMDFFVIVSNGRILVLPSRGVRINCYVHRYIISPAILSMRLT